MSDNDRQHVIIAGSTKCGTTALFRFLSDHPCIAGSRTKETRYFLGPEHELAPEERFDTRPGTYGQFWADSAGEPFLLEATPDYMYSRGIWKRLAEHLPDAHIVILLRSPADRLHSWYRYALQRGLLPPTCTFEDYVMPQLRGASPAEGVHPFSRALAEGRYARSLVDLVGTWPEDRLHVLSSEELLSQPRVVLARLCRSFGVDDSPYHAYEFERRNVSRRTRAPGVHRRMSLMWRRVESTLGRSRGLMGGARKFKDLLRPLYWGINGMRGDYAGWSQAPPTLRSAIDRYYGPSVDELRQLLEAGGQQAPEWASSHDHTAP